MRRFYLTWFVQCEDLAVQNSYTFREWTVARSSDRSNGVVHRSCASHFPRKNSIKLSRILFRRANRTNTSARTGFRGIESQNASDLLCQLICSAKRWADSFTASTLKSIRVWCCQGKGSFKGLLHDYFDYLTFEAPSYSMSSVKLFESPNHASFVIIGDFFA
jgi:hypothetical protein